MSWLDHDLWPSLGYDDFGTAASESVLIHRRRLLSGAAAAVAALLPAPRVALAGRASGSQASEALSFLEFLQLALPMARELVHSVEPEEEDYLFRMSSLLSRLEDPAAAHHQTMRSFWISHAEPGEARFPLVAMQVPIEPGGRLPPHDHRNYNGVLVGIEGEVRVKNYQILGETQTPPKGETFRIREFSDVLITPGRFSSLSRTRNNVHDLRAGRHGALLLDVFTLFGPDSRSYSMEVDGEARDADRRIYDARWVPESGAS